MIVLDCSAAISMVNRTIEGDAIQSLILPEEIVIAPELFYVEAASALRKHVKVGALGKREALEYLSDVVGRIDEFVPTSEIYIDAFHESIRMDHSIYDMLYFVLARRHNATLVTLDKQLIKLCE